MVYDHLVEITIDLIRDITGEPQPPPTCPWRTYTDPLIQAVQSVRQRKAAGLDMGPMSLRVLEATAYFERCLEAAREARRKAEDDQRKPRTEPEANHG